MILSIEGGAYLKILSIEDVGEDFKYLWPSQNKETFSHYIEYLGQFEQGDFRVKIGYTIRSAYGQERARIVTWINGYPFAEFIATDDYEKSGDLMSEIKLRKGDNRLMCRYPDDPVPPRYAMFNVQGLPTRITGKGVRNAWAVVANLCDHKSIISLAAMRQFEKDYY